MFAAAVQCAPRSGSAHPSSPSAAEYCVRSMDWITDMRFCAHGRLLAITTRAGMLSVWRVQRGSSAPHLSEHGGVAFGELYLRDFTKRRREEGSPSGLGCDDRMTWSWPGHTPRSG